MIADWTAEEREYLRDEVPRQALRTPFRGGTVQDLAKQVGVGAGSRGRIGQEGLAGGSMRPCPGCDWLCPAPVSCQLRHATARKTAAPMLLWACGFSSMTGVSHRAPLMHQSCPPPPCRCWPSAAAGWSGGG